MRLKKRILPLLLLAVLTVLFAAGCGKKGDAANKAEKKEPVKSETADKKEDDTTSISETTDNSKTNGEKEAAKQELTAVTLNEVAHSIFYAPMYAAIENGYFADEGIALELVTGFGADKVMAAVLAEEADIGFMGPETTVYTYNEGIDDAIVNFAQLTQRAGNFIVARQNAEQNAAQFQLSDLKGKEVLGGRAGGMPEMVFEYVLKQNKIDPSEVRIDQSIDFGSTAAAFSGGKGDYTVEFEPSATALEETGDGVVVSSVGVASGYVPYTAFSAKKSYIDSHKELIQSFTNALQKGMEYVSTHTSKEIAKTIQPQFSETKLETLTTIVDRYHAQDTWNTNLIFSEDSFELLLDILQDAQVITKRPPYDQLVDTTFADQAANRIDNDGKRSMKSEKDM